MKSETFASRCHRCRCRCRCRRRHHHHSHRFHIQWTNIQQAFGQRHTNQKQTKKNEEGEELSMYTSYIQII